MSAVKRPSATNDNIPSFDDVKQPELHRGHAVTQTFQTAAPPSGIWGWFRSAISYFSSRNVTCISEQPAVVIQTPALLEAQQIEIQQSEQARELEKHATQGDERQIAELQARIDFPPYDLVVKFPEGGEKTYSIQNPEEETRVIQELERWVNANFQSLKIVKGISSKEICRILEGQTARVRKIFEDRFYLHRKEYDTGERLGPRIVVEETLGSDLKRVCYANGIEEKQRFSQEKWQITYRRYPNGDFEEGQFDLEGNLFYGVRFSKGDYEFLSPRSIFFGSFPIVLQEKRCVFFEKQYVFSIVNIHGKERLALLERDDIVHSYRLSKEPPLPLLFFALKTQPFCELQKVLEAPLSPVSPKEVVEYAFAASENGEPPIFSLKEEDVLTILKEARKLQIPFHFHMPSPVTNETLFAKWAVKGHAPLIQCMIEMDPTCIDQTKERQVSFFRCALSVGKKEEALLIKSTMEARNLSFSEEDLWVERVHESDLSFRDEEFTALDPSFQKELYQTAHACGHIGLIDRMNKLGMKQSPLPPKGPTPLSINMDLIEQQRAIQSYLLELREKKRLLLSEEAPPNLQSFHCNLNDFSRVLGADFVKKTVQRLGLKHIDAAETFAILKPEASSICVSRNYDLYIQSDDMDIYAEKIVEVDRLISLEEAYELLDAIEATGFVDIHRENFMVTQDKIYFIDLESNNFQKRAAYEFMERLLWFVKLEDRDALYANIDVRIQTYNKKMTGCWAEVEEREKFEEKNRKVFFCGRPFYEFPVASILR